MTDPSNFRLFWASSHRSSNCHQDTQLKPHRANSFQTTQQLISMVATWSVGVGHFKKHMGVEELCFIWNLQIWDIRCSCWDPMSRQKARTCLTSCSPPLTWEFQGPCEVVRDDGILMAKVWWMCRFVTVCLHRFEYTFALITFLQCYASHWCK